MSKTDIKSNTYRGQDVLIEHIRSVTKDKIFYETDEDYYKDWNSVCDRLAKEAEEEGLLSTKASILELKEFLHKPRSHI